MMATNYYIIGMVIGIILLLIIAIWALLRWLKKRKLSKQLNMGIPNEILNDFNEAERRIKGGEANGNPYQILWEVARERNRIFQESRPDRAREPIQDTRIRRTTSNIEPANGDIQGDRKPEQGRDIQVHSDSNITEDKRKPKTDWADFS